MQAVRLNSRHSQVLLTFLFFALGANPASSNGFRNPPPSASTLALDGGKSVLVEDLTGLAANPALLGKQDRPGAAVSITLIDAESSFTSAVGNKTSTRNNGKMLPNVFAAVPLNSNIVFGLGITTPYGQSVEWPRESGLPYFTELRLIDISPAISVKCADRIIVGAALNIYTSTFETKQTIPWPQLLNDPTLPYGSAGLRGDGSALGATAGLLLQLTPSQRASLVYRSSFGIDYDGDTTLSGTPTTLSQTMPSKSDFTTTIEFPSVAAAGYALDVSDHLTLAAEIEWIEFSRFDELPVDAGLLQQSGLFPPAIPQRWNDSWTYGAAARWKCSDQFQLRSSYRFLESPIPDSTQAPTLPDADKHVLGVGFGWKTGRLNISAGYAYTIFANRNVSVTDNAAFPGSYDLSSHIISTTLCLTL